MLGEFVVRDMQQGADGDARERTDSMTEVMRVLRREHANMMALVKALEWQLGEFAAGRLPDYDVVRSALDYFLSFPDLYHHPKEDLIYLKLKERSPEVAGRVGDLRREHEAIAARTREFAAGLRAVLDEAQVPREAFLRWGNAFIDLQKGHMQMEETEFFPAAMRHLSDEDWRELEAAMTSPEDPLFGEKVGERFETLRHAILKWQEDHRRSTESLY